MREIPDTVADRIHKAYEIGKKALENPVPYAKWVMFYTNSTDDIIYNSLNKNNNFRDNYMLVYSDEGLELYKRK